MHNNIGCYDSRNMNEQIDSFLCRKEYTSGKRALEA